jgi:hypothetical protein
MRELPGKQILAKFASRAGLDVGRAKTLYINQVHATGADTFDDIVAILAEFDRQT